MKLSRRNMLGQVLASGGGLYAAGGLPSLFLAKGVKVKIGATDWNLQQEAKLEAVALAKRIGFDGVEVSLGVGGNDKLPLDNPDRIHAYREEAKKNKLPIASTCLNILHRNYLKND